MEYTMIGHASDDDWLDLRMRGIGASEMAAVLGVSPRKSALRLYAEKTGAMVADDLKDNEAVGWGHKLESLIIEAFGDRTGRRTTPSGQLLQSATHPWAIATLDAWTWIDDDQALPLEIKTTSAYRAGDWEDGPPEIYGIQLHHQMLVTGAPKASIACLIGGQRLVWCDVDRDDILIRRIIAAGTEFWSRVTDRVPPSPDGTASAGRALRALYPDDNGDVAPLPGTCLEYDQELQLVEHRLQELHQRREELRQRIAAAIGDAYGGVLANGVRYTWGTTTKPEHIVKASRFRVLRRHATKEG